MCGIHWENILLTFSAAASELSDELSLLLSLLLSESDPELLLESPTRAGWTGNGGMGIGTPPLLPLPPRNGIDSGAGNEGKAWQLALSRVYTHMYMCMTL